jgi:hypothetical protein
MPYLARPFNRIRETVAYKSAGQRCGSSGRNAFVVPFVRRHSFCEWAVAPEPGLDSPGDGLFFAGPFLALQNEKVAGIAPSQRQIDANAVAEQQLYRQLLHRSSGG